MLNVVMLNVVMLSVLMLSVLMLSVVVLSVAMLNVVMLSVVEPFYLTIFILRRRYNCPIVNLQNDISHLIICIISQFVK
jgi:hypothetical protein